MPKVNGGFEHPNPSLLWATISTIHHRPDGSDHGAPFLATLLALHFTPVTWCFEACELVFMICVIDKVQTLLMIFDEED